VSLRGRLLVAFAYLLVLAVAALAVPLAINIQRRARSDVEARLASQAQIISSSVSGEIEDSDAPEILAPIVEDFAEQLDVGVLVADEDGRVVANSEPQPSVGTNLGGESEVRTALGSESLVGRPRGSHLLVAAPVFDREEPVGVVRLDADISRIDSNVRRSWLVLAAVGLFVVMLGSGAAWLLASSLVRPLRNLGATARSLGAGRLDSRADTRGPPEVTDVARAMNNMAEDLEATISAQQDFVANASHQLRTPLTGLRLRLESISVGGGPDANSAAEAIKEVDRLGALVEELLVLARARGGQAAGGSVDIGGLLRDAADRWAARAAERGGTIVTHVGAGAIVHADQTELAGVVDNLIENALAYSPTGATITLTSESGPDGSGFSVADDGPGIPPEEREHVFNRFYRGGIGRRSGRGTGLGLAIVKEVAEKWDGSAEIASSPVGTTVTLRWPRDAGAGATTPRPEAGFTNR
jgi:two-component system, OmpR family, sensor kinase